MDTTHMQDSSQLAHDVIGVRCLWTVRERDRHTGLVVAQKTVKNIWTNGGLTALASGTIGTNLYLCVENPGVTVKSTISAGSSSVTTTAQAHQAGDTQLILSLGLANQETVTFTVATANGDGSYTYTLSPSTAQPHSASDIACRQVSVNDTMTNVQFEQQYDATNAPSQRMQLASGYSQAIGGWTYQFYYPGPLLQTTLVLVGMADSPIIGQGNLLNHFTLGYTHNNTNNDLELDGVLTLSNI